MSQYSSPSVPKGYWFQDPHSYQNLQMFKSLIQISFQYMNPQVQTPKWTVHLLHHAFSGGTEWVTSALPWYPDPIGFHITGEFSFMNKFPPLQLYILPCLLQHFQDPLPNALPWLLPVVIAICLIYKVQPVFSCLSHAVTCDIHWIIKKARVPEKHLFLLYWLC